MNNTVNSMPQNQDTMAGRWFMNPMVRKLRKVTERDEENSASYVGIGAKTVWFLIMTIAGIGVYFLLNSIFPADILLDEENAIAISIPALLGAGIALLFSLITPLIAFLIRPAIPVVGTLYCLSIGYVISFLGNTFAMEYKNIVWLALGITIILVLVMALIYQTGIVKIGKKFRTVVSCLFFSSLLVSLMVFVMSLIPATRGIAQFVSNNILYTIGGSIIFIILACLMLLTDFDTVRNTVDNHLPKKYEWLAAFSLAYTVIWLYLKVLDLLIQIQNKKN